MWGSSIVGFGSYHCKYESGREGDWFLTGFSPRKQNLTLYLMAEFEQYPELLKALGKYKTGKSCLYINRLEDIHLPTLKKLVQQSVKHMTNASKTDKQIRSVDNQSFMARTSPALGTRKLGRTSNRSGCIFCL